jgi:hypothetical protein
MDSSRLPKQAYLMQLSEDNNGKTCWASQIRQILSKAGFLFVWLNQGAENKKVFLSTLKQRLIDMYLQEWNATIRVKERYSLFSSLVKNFGCSDYVFYIDIHCFKEVITQLRCGVLPINCNVHRYSEHFQDKTCPFCNDAEEDEVHFIFSCPLYSELRKWFSIDRYDQHALVRLLTCNQKYETINLAKFVFYALKKRQRSLAVLAE